MKINEAKFWYFIVSLLSNKLVYYSFMYVMAFSTTGKFSGTIASELTGMDAIKRFDKELKIHKK